jgi:hypothetical protein
MLSYQPLAGRLIRAVMDTFALVAGDIKAILRVGNDDFDE